MFPYSGRPTEEFLREYRNKLNELQELMESQGLKLEIKSGGRCIVVPEVKAGLGKVSGNSNDIGDGNLSISSSGSSNDADADNSFMLAYSQQYNAKADSAEDNLESETVYETYEDYLDFERKLTLIHEARDNDVVIDFSSDFLDLAPVEEERLLFKDEAQLYGRFCQEVFRRLHGVDSRTLAWKRITSDYNTKRLVHIKIPLTKASDWIRRSTGTGNWLIMWDSPVSSDSITAMPGGSWSMTRTMSSSARLHSARRSIPSSKSRWIRQSRTRN